MTSLIDPSRSTRVTSALAVSADAGPPSSPTARAGVGAVSRRCLRLDIPQDADGLLVADAALSSGVLIAGDRLVYYVFAGFAPGHIPDTGALHWAAGGYAATGVGVDLLFSDGRRLSTSNARDHHGVAVDAESQGSSKSVSVDQWTRKEVDLTAFAGATVVGAEVHVSAHGAPHDAVAWLDGPFVEPGEPVPTSPVEHVDTRRGSHSSRDFSRGNTVPATALPHGGVLVVPMTSTDDASWPYSYHLHNDADNATPFRGIALSHAATPWFGDWGVLHLRPALDGGDDHGSRFVHADERAHPHEYAVRLENGIGLRVAPTGTGAVAHVSFPTDSGSIVLDQAPAGGEVSIVEHDGARIALVRSAAHGPMIAGAPLTHYALAFDVPVARVEPAASGVWAESATLRVDDSEVVVRIATSTIDVEHALARLDEAVAAGGGVDDAAEAAAAAWNALLGRLRVEGTTPDRLTSVYSSLYRLFLYPSALGERTDDGLVSPDVFAFRPDTPPSGRTVQGDVVINNGFWDTYRTAWPAYALLAPDLAGPLLDGFVRHFHESGWVPRWSAPGFVDCMVGTSSDIVFADAVAKGVALADLEAAYDSGVKNALVPSPERSAGRVGLERALFLGYAPDEVHEGMSWTLESAINDFGLASLSRALLDRLGDGHPRAAELRANAAYFRDRSRAYTAVHDATTGFFRGRRVDGSFSTPSAEYDPRVWGGDYVETNAFGMNFSVPHDGAGLARLLGGREALRERLDAYFDTNERGDEAVWGWYGRNVHEMTEARDVRMGMFALSNQPAHHIPYMYAHTGAHDRTQAIVRESLSRLFLGSEFGQGYPGDEDNGEMSCWYLFGALGLYPLAVGSTEYVFTSPLFPVAEFDVADERTVRIETRAADPAHVYIQSVLVDGEAWHGITIDHARLLEGCLIEIELGADPSDWFEDSHPSSVTAENEGVHPLVDLLDADAGISADFAGAELLHDDDASTGVEVPAGGVIRCVTTVLREVRLYTITCGAAPGDGPTAWTLRGERPDGSVVELARESGVAWRWPYETRVFAVSAPEPLGRHELGFDGDRSCTVGELQLLAPR
ncbi:GH92 family glycosyl hydrolase [Microbacterium sp. ZW T5_45]|uniref:GH92 family glycosyl hydrolase n=1 Tax=Microbacterium sp. ZW T5_45 TaxID=3378080 RepID=UPI0038543C6B